MLGSVESLWRYPVRSMRGEMLERVEVSPRGVVGDRSYSVVDAPRNLRVTVGDAPRRWMRMLEAEARFAGEPRLHSAPPPVRIRFDDGAECDSDDPGAAAWLSEKLAQPVALWRDPDAAGAAPADEAGGAAASGAAPRHAYEAAPLHLITTASLRAAAAQQPDARFDPVRFRPNIVIDTGSAEGFLEDGWLGRTLALGDALRIEVHERSERCVMTTLGQGDLARDPRIFQTVARANQRCFGVYARVLTPGHLRRGDSVTLL
ncbi:MAG: MOSC domain-containing protein [Myxococcales bacterium]|nr:MOSC domain-containing protein [Myxococcales bacterium]MDH5306083.1 MOSC domain-containing protein [Myxococcales bacterium]